MILGSVLGLAYGLYSLGNKNLKSQGNLVVNGDFGIYSDPQTSHSLTSLQFGDISLGNNYLTTYIKNRGTVNITLEISSIALNSSSDGLTLSNNYEGAVIEPGAAVQIQWDMSVTNQFAPAGTYNFEITISSVRA
jgi:archaellum component FlaG (FlaF/FlaG flagellin family)